MNLPRVSTSNDLSHLRRLHFFAKDTFTKQHSLAVTRICLLQWNFLLLSAYIRLGPLQVPQGFRQGHPPTASHQCAGGWSNG